jgi:hypothetical protein
MLIGMMSAVLATMASAAAADDTATKTARCVITSGGGNYTGPCQFLADNTGSFVLTRADNAVFWGGVVSLGVYIDAPGSANLVIAQSDGTSQGGGALKRSDSDKACWTGDAITICAY